MKSFDQQTSNDLEFDLIRLLLHDYCTSPSAQLRTVDLCPSSQPKWIIQALEQTHELKRINEEGIDFPSIRFIELGKELEMLEIKGAVLEPESIFNIRNQSELVNRIVKVLKEVQEEFPVLSELCLVIPTNKAIIKAVDQVFDNRGEIKNDATPELENIRKSILNTKRNITRNFNQVVKKYKDKGWLADTQEAFLNERRLLAVESTYKRQVPGTVIGSSKTGQITYLEPQENIGLNFELEMLLDDERKEIQRILKMLTEKLADHLMYIRDVNALLIDLDFIQAKMRLAQETNASLPGISSEKELELIEAYHPILYLNNLKEKRKTLPQTLRMDKFSRMLVISGPNAGGKSITLKTVGLLQIMLQSGLLVPVDPNSRMCIFQHILSDIGDNQSIENQLSTYSYRLKRMKQFLEVTNKNSLLLLDEFGTGSDPELGGALAEVFFEKLYNKKCFGVITTHYSNIKLKASQLRNAVNGCMLFDKESLEPLFKLSVGQPGSSFTFEVAQINGIDEEIIHLAKEKLDENRVRMDRMISELQIEKAKTEQLNKSFEQQQQRSQKAEEDFTLKKQRLDDKLKIQKDLTEENNQLIRKGKKMDRFIQRYKSNTKNKELVEDIIKFIGVEKTKQDDEYKAQKLKEQAKKKKLRKAKKRQHLDRITVGSTVRLNNSKQAGTVLEIKDKQALVAFGNFKTQCDINHLIWVK